MRAATLSLLLLLLLLLLLYWVVAGDSDTNGSKRTAVDWPRLLITLNRGQVRLEGHVASRRHEQQLLQAAGELFAGYSIITKLETRDSVSPQWVEASDALLVALSATVSSSATLTDRSLVIRGVGHKEWPERLKFLRRALPQPIDLEVDMLVPDTGFGSAEACARAFASHRHGAIKFEQSGTTLRNSAYPVLDRLLSLADTCRESRIFITGHSDASGDETWNRRLSLTRAKTVADHLAGHGIARDRLVAAGAGSSAPIADNGTRYGRSLNRRIEVDFRQYSQPGEP